VEGPSLYLAAEQLRPFAGRRIQAVGGNSKIGIERLARQTVRNIFSWGGKHHQERGSVSDAHEPVHED
jgi:hypothetical protein